MLENFHLMDSVKEGRERNGATKEDLEVEY